MADIDAYFTQTIVGAPFSVVLGERASAATVRAGMGVEVPLDGRAARMGDAWKQHMLLGAGHAGPFVRPLPSPQRLWLERHALVIAGAGMLSIWASGLWALWIYLS